MELTTEDRERIRKEGRHKTNDHYQSKLSAEIANDAYYKGFKAGAEYATIYEREQQIKTLNRPGSKYYVSYDPDYKDKVFGVFNKEDLTQQGAQKMAQQLNNLEAERSELRNKAEEYRRLLLRAEMYVLPTEQTHGLISDIRNSLKK